MCIRDRDRATGVNTHTILCASVRLYWREFSKWMTRNCSWKRLEAALEKRKASALACCPFCQSGMMNKDLHSIPRIRDRLSYLYVEHAKIDQNGQAIAIHDALGETPVPCAGLAMLMLGPGITITHAAILSLAACGCLVAWVGEHGVRFYAAGTGTTRSAVNLMKQAKYWADPVLHLRVVRSMYQLRFQDELSPDLTLNQIRGKEGARVRDTYFQLLSLIHI